MAVIAKKLLTTVVVVGDKWKDDNYKNSTLCGSLQEVVDVYLSLKKARNDSNKVYLIFEVYDDGTTRIMKLSISEDGIELVPENS